MAPNVGGALSYLLGPITGILFYVLEPKDAFVRFHAAQSTILFGALIVASFLFSAGLTVLSLIPGIGWIAATMLGIFALLLWPITFVAWIFLMYKAYNGEEFEVPVVARYARRYGAVASD